MSLSSLHHTSRPFQTKQEWVYATLKEGIQSGALAPGLRLTLDDLAEQLSVSRVPVREALLQLQVEGLVDMEPHMGAVVSPVSLDSIYEVFLILEELEVLAGRAVAERACEQELADLKGILDKLETAVHARDMERWAELNAEFHCEIGRLSGMPFLHQITETALQRWDRVRRCYLSEVLSLRIDHAQEHHRRIYQALTAGDGEMAEKLLRHHNRKALEAYLAHLSDKERSRLETSRAVD